VIRVLAATFLLLAAVSASAAELDVKDLVDRANKALRGDSSRGRLTMTIETPEWKRSLEVEGWNKDRTMAFIVIRAPAKERGETTLRRRNEMWLWMPKVERVIKIPPTMMHAAWQGSDFTYEDIVKADSIVKDYSHRLLSTKHEAGRTVYSIECLPKADAPVVWGKIVTDVALYDDQSVVPLLEEDYSERGELIRTITLSDVKILGGRRVPSKLVCVPALKKGQRTTLVYQELEFDLPLKDDFFSYQRLQKGGS
jgi:outer membrane lipoprotein-sorting protein